MQAGPMFGYICNMKIILNLSIIIFLISCAQKTTPVATAQTNETFNLKLKELKNISGEKDTYVRFDSVITDSRCPKDVQCIWQGIATVKLLIGNKTEQHAFNLSTINFKENKTDTTLLGYKVELVNLDPYPGSKNADPLVITAALKLTKQ